MTKRQVFYSFHYENDVMRVQEIRNIGAIEDNTPVSNNDWEEIKKQGEDAVKKWIDDNMKYRSCVIVLIGEETASRKWVKYEIEKAWKDKKGLLGIYIHNIDDPQKGKCKQGKNPFDFVYDEDGRKLSESVLCKNPDVKDAYNDIRKNLADWIEESLS